MCERSEEDNNNHLPTPNNLLLMDLDDLDLDASCPPLDHFPLSSNPMIMSPLLISPSEQPCSPLWAFSDPAAAYDDEKLSYTSALAPSFRLSEYPLFLTYAGTSNPVGEGTAGNGNAQLPSSLSNLMPLDNESYWVIKQRMTQALRSFKESTKQHVLAQVWAPIEKDGRYVLTTSGQPFVLDPHSNGLNQYRTVSLTYMFSVDGESDVELGLPGRVFRHKLPEWTPNVQYYSSREFSRLDHALHYNVRGTLALPVFGSSGQSCVGVVELIMTSEKINYAPEVDKVCKALQAVNLKSSEILDHQNTEKICNLSRRNALGEILEILTVVCETHKLPLAQTWVPCMHRSVLANGGGLKKSCTSFDGSCMGQVCMSTTDAACYVVDAHVWGFRDACLEHHLQKSQGVAGRAFLTRSSCFCRDVTRFCKTEYPLVHYARMFKLTSCFAICLQSSHTGDDDYILEFFLPSTIADRSEQDSLLGCLLATMKPHFQSLRVASGIEIGQNQVTVEIVEASADKKIDLKTVCIQIPVFEKSPLKLNPSPGTGELLLNSLKQPRLNLDPVDSEGIFNGKSVDECHASAATTTAKETKKREKKRGKAEKTISLDVLQQYFSGSLKDAAKSLGVCPTTMKRICRQHGISRWPSRKINKVNRSLTKLKGVIQSVQGTEGALDLTTLASRPLPCSIIRPPNSNGTLQSSSPTGSKPAEPLPRNDWPNCGSPPTDPLAGTDEFMLPGKLTRELFAHEQNCLAELSNPSKRSKTDCGSREESAGNPTPHASNEGGPVNEKEQPIRECRFPTGGSPEFEPEKEENFSSAFSVPNLSLLTGLQDRFGGILVKDAGSSEDLRIVYPLIPVENFPESSWANPIPVSEVPPKEAVVTSQPRPGMTSITIKATYREDMIRFRISLNSGIEELKEEVAKRLKLEMGTFDIKYLDDDHEWVLIACDADLQECLDVSQSSGANIIRLSVHDMMTNPGSSCESTRYL